VLLLYVSPARRRLGLLLPFVVSPWTLEEQSYASHAAKAMGLTACFVGVAYTKKHRNSRSLIVPNLYRDFGDQNFLPQIVSESLGSFWITDNTDKWRRMASSGFFLSGFQELVKIVAIKQTAAENQRIDLTDVVNLGQRIRV